MRPTIQYFKSNAAMIKHMMSGVQSPRKISNAEIKWHPSMNFMSSSVLFRLPIGDRTMGDGRCVAFNNTFFPSHLCYIRVARFLRTGYGDVERELSNIGDLFGPRLRNA